MARMIEYDGMERINGVLTRLSRDAIRQVVMAGAAACVQETKDNIVRYRHVLTGQMMQNVAPGKYHEDYGSGWVEVYPQGDDSRGISNAKKAFVINYGRGGRRTDKTGDKFITGEKKTMQEVVSRAMQAESDRIIQELNGG
jgi:hypothetical protein